MFIGNRNTAVLVSMQRTPTSPSMYDWKSTFLYSSRFSTKHHGRAAGPDVKPSSSISLTLQHHLKTVLRRASIEGKSPGYEHLHPNRCCCEVSCLLSPTSRNNDFAMAAKPTRNKETLAPMSHRANRTRPYYVQYAVSRDGRCTRQLFHRSREGRYP